MTGLAAVQSRIAHIEARIATMESRTGAASTATGGTSFARTLAAVQAGLATSAAGAPTPAGTGGATGADLVQAASKYLGVPYRWGGTDPATGLDCSGLVQRAMADLGVDVPRVVADQQHVGREVAGLAQARPGDLLVWHGSTNHVAIYVGDGKMLHAPRTGDVVRVTDVWSTPPATIRRVLPAPGEASPSAGPTAGVAANGSGPYAGILRAAERRNDLPTGLLSAVARVESGFDADAVSPAGAVGLMQLMPATAAGLGVDPRDPVQAADGAGRYLRQQLDSFGDLRTALAAYNAGPGNVRRYGGVPPFTETQQYVTRVMSALGTHGGA